MVVMIDIPETSDTAPPWHWSAAQHTFVDLVSDAAWHGWMCRRSAQEMPVLGSQRRRRERGAGIYQHHTMFLKSWLDQHIIDLPQVQVTPAAAEANHCWHHYPVKVIMPVTCSLKINTKSWNSFY